MIIKLIQGQDFGGLDHYLTHAREHEIVRFVGVSCADDAAAEMALVAAERPDVRAPAFHVIFAAAPQDWPKMTSALWDELYDRFEAEFHLSGHQKLIVKHPHPDGKTDGPHVHVAYNKLHPFTFDLPPIHKQDRASWDSGAKQRAWAVADGFAQDHGLERVADPTLVDANGRMPNWVRKREANSGVVSVGEFAPQIRTALIKPTWSERMEALALLGLKIIPTYPPSQDESHGCEITGIRIADALDENNHLKGSLFGREFSYPQLERGRAPGTPSLRETMVIAEQKVNAPAVSRTLDARGLYLLEFNESLALWRARRESDRAKRKALKIQHSKEQADLSEKLSHHRSNVLSGTPRAFHAQARQAFAALVATPQRDALRKQQQEELQKIVTPTKPTWTLWLGERANAGDTRAAVFLKATLGRKLVRSKTPKADAAAQLIPPADLAKRNSAAEDAIVLPASTDRTASQRSDDFMTAKVDVNPLESGPAEPSSHAGDEEEYLRNIRYLQSRGLGR